jgi:putative spermidine/putrescine transport system substrate-binding protein
VKGRIRKRHVVFAALVVALSIPAAGSSRGNGLPTKIGAGEGKLTMIAWQGYTQPQWVTPFEKQTGCKVEAKYAGSSDEMVALMRSGGGGQYDMVSASGDASLRLIYGGDVAPVNVGLVPSWKQFFKAFQSPPNNTVKGVHYGISLQFGPNILMYNPKLVKKPTSWSVIYNPANKGKITIPDNPIQIADAALYLASAQPSLGIKDPYELNSTQFNAAVSLLKKQKPLVKKYWSTVSDQVDLFSNGGSTLGASWPVMLSTLKAAHKPVASVIPKEGATGWLDTWMVSKKAKDPNCAYKWLAYISTPKVQAMQATNYGETPVNSLACGYMNKLVAGSCKQYFANAPESYYRSIKFWKTPLAACGNGQNNCMDYTKWVQAWTNIKG